MAFIDIFGSLTDQSGVPVVGARIIIAAQRNSSVAFRDMTVAQITGEDGAYAFSLAPGYYRVLISYNNDRRTVMTGEMKLEEGSEPGTLNDYVIFAEPVLATPTVYSEIKSWHEQVSSNTADSSGNAQVASDAAKQAQDHAQISMSWSESSADYAAQAKFSEDESKHQSESAASSASDARGFASAAQASAATTGVYPDVATGLAKTTDGQSFSVAQGSGREIAIIVYLNNGGVAQQVAELASFALVEIIRIYFEMFQNLTNENGTANLHEFYDKNQNLIAFIDNAGSLYLTDMAGRSVQDINTDVTEISESVGKSLSPAIQTLTDANSAMLGFVDSLTGGHYLSGMNGASVDEFADKTQRRLDYLYRSRQTFNAVTDFSIDNQGKNSCAFSAQAAIDFVASLPGGGAIHFPKGVYRLHKSLIPRNNVIITMPAKGARFLPVGKASGFFKPTADTSYLTNAAFIDVEIDGAEQNYYNAAVKGIYVQYFRDCLFLRNNIHDISATGLGIDFPDRSFILDCVTNNCGRLAQVGNGGSSGIGIGTGALQDEPLIISRCINKNNKNFGIFFEQQRDSNIIWQSRQAIVSESVCTGNQWGFGDCGISGVIVSNCQLNDNIEHGVMMDSGTLGVNNNRPQPGGRGLITGCQILRNGSHGINYESLSSKGNGGYMFSNNRIQDNAGHAIYMAANSKYTIPDMFVTGNDIADNTGSAVWVNSGIWSDLDIVNNRMLRNGGNIKLDGNVSAGSIYGNRIRSMNGSSAISGAGSISNVDIDGNQYTDHAQKPVDLTGTQTGVTYGRNPGL